MAFIPWLESISNECSQIHVSFIHEVQVQIWTEWLPSGANIKMCNFPISTGASAVGCFMCYNGIFILIWNLMRLPSVVCTQSICFEDSHSQLLICLVLSSSSEVECSEVDWQLDVMAIVATIATFLQCSLSREIPAQNAFYVATYTSLCYSFWS